jgi:ABC-type antimicrobial peptide transport system permease subunit
MVSWLAFFLGVISGSIITIVALALVRGNWSKKDIVDIDPERQWKEQSKGY